MYTKRVIATTFVDMVILFRVLLLLEPKVIFFPVSCFLSTIANMTHICKKARKIRLGTSSAVVYPMLVF